MNCPRCNAKVAFMKNQCDNCGQDLRDYRKIISLSNIYYNKGLEQAKVRDLSGAIRSLRQSLEFNKYNTNARNLLGLIFFEEGEVVSALSEWVISKHFQDQNNDADRYINVVQANPNKLEMYNQTIKKYNAALYAAQHGDEDMAIIQLKKVVNLNPKFVRAHQLLALLYMMSGKRDNRVRAKRLLKSIIKVDVTNTTTIRYLNELSDIHLKGENTAKSTGSEPQKEVRKTLPRVEADAYKTITPYKEEKPSVLPFINVIVGVVIGMALMGFLIMPHINANKSNDANSEFKKYSEQKAASESDLSTLKNENKELQKELEKVKKENDELKGDTSGTGTTMQESYESFIAAIQYYEEKDNANAAKSLLKVNKDSIEDENMLALYKEIKKTAFPEASKEYFERGRNAYNGQGEYAGKKDYDKAIKLLEKSLEFDATNTDAMYFMGRCYQQKSEAEEAKKYYNQILEEYPDSTRVSEAQSRLRELGE
ncbi:MAG: tetratricopeptide repeat protein [Butyribacter sp.]|nr:tetratricopeptide repeat protein [bacterium]MDY3853808.1 tetratricopeptide repeat protein [Butyribacter sp.]